jgi:hypothetical protein
MPQSESFAYTVTIDIPSWPKSPPTPASRLAPVLSISREEPDDWHALLQVSLWIDDLPRNDRWVVQYFEPEERGVLNFDWREAGIDNPKFRRPKRPVRGLSVGEAKRDPRDTCAAAFARAIELLTELAAREDVARVREVMDVLMPALEKSSKSYAMKYRPPKA